MPAGDRRPPPPHEPPRGRASQGHGQLRHVSLVWPSGKQPFSPPWTRPHSQRPSLTPLTPLLYTWTELSAVQRQTALTLLRESERRRRARRRILVLTVLLLFVLLTAFVVFVAFVLGQFAAFSI